MLHEQLQTAVAVSCSSQSGTTLADVTVDNKDSFESIRQHIHRVGQALRAVEESSTCRLETTDDSSDDSAASRLKGRWRGSSMTLKTLEETKYLIKGKRVPVCSEVSSLNNCLIETGKHFPMRTA